MWCCVLKATLMDAERRAWAVFGCLRYVHALIVLRACVPACLRACVPACLRACVPFVTCGDVQDKSESHFPSYFKVELYFEEVPMGEAEYNAAFTSALGDPAVATGGGSSAGAGAGGHAGGGEW